MPRLHLAETDRTDELLDWVEAIGGGYVWDGEVQAVTLMDVALHDSQAEKLAGLSGVGQIALNAERLSVDALRGLAAIEGLSSLVLRNARLSTEDVERLAKLGPEVELVPD